MGNVCNVFWVFWVIFNFSSYIFYMCINNSIKSIIFYAKSIFKEEAEKWLVHFDSMGKWHNENGFYSGSCKANMEKV